MPPPAPCSPDSGVLCFVFKRPATTGVGESIVFCPPLEQKSKVSVEFKRHLMHTAKGQMWPLNIVTTL